MSLNTKMLLFALVVFVGLGTAAYLAMRPQDERYVLDTFQYSTVGTRDFRDVVTASGRVVPAGIVALTAPADAVVLSIARGVGDDVEKGDVLAILTSEGLLNELDAAERAHEIALIELHQAQVHYEQELSDAESELAKAEEALEEAEAKVPVMENLFALGGISRKELEDARAAARAAEAAYFRAEDNHLLAGRKAELTVKKSEQQERAAWATLADLEQRAGQLEVVAGERARLLESGIEPGDRVRTGDTLFRLADVRAQYVEAAITPQQAAGITVGGRALVRSGDKQVEATVSHVAPLAVSADSGSHVPVRLALAPEIAAGLLPFAPVSVEIELGALKERPFLPRGPYFTSGNASFVYVLNDDHTEAERRDVRYGAIDGEYIEVVSGLERDEQIVYSSYTAFRSFRSIDLIPEGGRAVE